MSFKNVEELRELIKLGWSNEEIIKSRLAYLNSEEYKKIGWKQNIMKILDKFIFMMVLLIL